MIDEYNKLVRDKIPEVIKQNGDTPKIMILDDENYFDALNEKLKEEVAEYLDGFSIDELADIMEVVYALVGYKGLSIKDFEDIRMKKREKRGGFDKRISLIEVKRED